MRYTDEEREIARDVNFGTGQTVKVVVIAVILTLLLSAGVWAFHVATSSPKGQGDAYSKQQSAENRIKAQAEFNKRYQSVQALDKNVNQAYIALQRDPKNTRRQIEFDGNIRNCNDAVGEYNSFSNSYLNDPFRPANLPVNIDDNDPSTDCKENS